MTQQSLAPDYPLVIGFENWALATQGARALGSSAAAGGRMPDSHAITENLDTAWRSGTISAAVELHIDLASVQTIDYICLARTNVRSPVRVTLHRSGAQVYRSNPDFDPVVQAVDPVNPANRSRWQTGETEARLDSLQSRFLLDLPIFLPPTQCDGIILRFDTSGGNDGVNFIQVGLVMAGRLFQPRINMSHGWGISVDDLSHVHETASGERVGVTGSRLRRVNLSMNHLSFAEGWDRVLKNWLVDRGRLAKVFVWAQPQERLHYYSQAIVGTLTQNPTLTVPGFEESAVRGLTIRESP